MSKRGIKRILEERRTIRNIDQETRKALFNFIKNKKREGKTLEYLINIWVENCAIQENLELGKRQIIAIWNALERKKFFNIGGNFK